MSENFGAFDLFGEPIRAGFGKKGRPPFEKTDEKRNKVMMLLAFGWTNAKIAAAMGITEPTLRKHFFSELKVRDESRERLQAAHFAMIYEAARGGNVAAMKELGSLIDRAEREALDRKFDGAERPSEKARREGKKERAQREAETAGLDSEWGDDLIPDGLPARLDG